ncbi:hypothetical protein LSH36_1105g00039 [Paralvinella palmiformis]|uniref:Sulfotransferase domain-containing protein n=1 Tax=Paralvinella palmiformis TaxID=53620 RepID=A0AAD9IVK2_9ANNE|nr:hypothetical protein LSH36_1105g00039 [Paralvinella palmiformis]
MQKTIDKRKKKNSENLGWRIRCFPYFFLIGFTKCGTTDLFGALSHIPDFIRPLTKEPEYWEKYRLTDQIQKGDLDPKTIWWYPNWKSIKGNENRDEPKYLTQHHFYHLSKEAKFLILLRNPVERTFSHYQFFAKKRKFTVRPKEFHDQIERFLQGLQTCFKKKSFRSCVYQALVCRMFND